MGLSSITKITRLFTRTVKAPEAAKICTEAESYSFACSYSDCAYRNTFVRTTAPIL